MFDVFLQRDVDLKAPDCGGVFSLMANPTCRDDLIFHFGSVEVGQSEPVAQVVLSAFNLLGREEGSFFSLSNDPESLDRNDLEKFLQADIKESSAKDPLVHMKEIVAKPILDLKEEEVKLPSSRVKKFAPRALEYLASHSEDWRNRSYIGVHPQRLQSLVRDDKWETYENRLLYTLSKTLNEVISKRLQELKDVDDAYSELECYYLIVDRTGYGGMNKEIDRLLSKYSPGNVQKCREKLDQTRAFLERLQMSIRSFWNSSLFSNLKCIPNVEVDINHFIPTNVLMNNPHYRFLPMIQKKLVNVYAKGHSRQVKFDGQKKLIANEMALVKRCVADFETNYSSWWQILQPKMSENEFEIVLECKSRILRFAFASSKPSSSYFSRMSKASGKVNVVSVLIYPQANHYLSGTADSYEVLLELFSRQLPAYGSYSALGVAPQSVFSKLLIQRLLFLWIWPMVIEMYPVKFPPNHFLDEGIPREKLLEGCLATSHEVSEFTKHVESTGNGRLFGKKFDNICKEECRILEEANKLISAVQKCPYCGKIGVLLPNAMAKNYVLVCRKCRCSWGRNGQAIKWMTPNNYGQSKLYGVLEKFEIAL